MGEHLCISRGERIKESHLYYIYIDIDIDWVNGDAKLQIAF